VILLVAGEHARELITSEIVFWLGKLLAGIDDELADWAAIQTVTASAWERGFAKGTLKEWAGELLTKVLFKVGLLSASLPEALCVLARDNLQAE
jgi:Ser/Thr protein kinase RdoA (MazF antagonist)